MKRNKLSKIRKSLIKCIDWIDNITGEFFHHPIPPPPLETFLRSGMWWHNTQDKTIYIYINQKWEPAMKSEKHTSINHKELKLPELVSLDCDDIIVSDNKKSVMITISDSEYEKVIKFYYVLNGEKVYLDVIKTLGNLECLSHTEIKKAEIKTGFVSFDSKGDGSNGYAYAQLLLSFSDHEVLFLFSHDCDIPVGVCFEIKSSNVNNKK